MSGLRTMLIAISLVVAGCGHRAPDSCDGADRRPINPGKWNEQVSFTCGRSS